MSTDELVSILINEGTASPKKEDQIMFCTKELNRVDFNRPDCRIQVVSGTGSTKWLNVNKDLAKALITKLADTFQPLKS